MDNNPEVECGTHGLGYSSLNNLLEWEVLEEKRNAYTPDLQCLGCNYCIVTLECVLYVSLKIDLVQKVIVLLLIFFLIQHVEMKAYFS